MTIGGRKIQTRSPAVSPTNTNDLSPPLVTPSHWLVNTFLSSDWQKPQLYFPFWLMFVSTDSQCEPCGNQDFSHDEIQQPFVLSFQLHYSYFSWIFALQIYLLSCLRHIILSPGLNARAYLNILKKAKNCRQGSSFSGLSLSCLRPLSRKASMQASDWPLLSTFKLLIGHCLNNQRTLVSTAGLQVRDGLSGE